MNCSNREWTKKSLKKDLIPGAVVMVINATDTLYAEAFGHQSLTPKRHINPYLSEPQKRIFHPDFPSNSVTLRKLLSYSASTATSRQVTNSYYHPGDTAFAESLTDACYRIINPTHIKLVTATTRHSNLIFE
ncbi:unnamed protein product [Rotaria socialis]|uniref:Uncharacterized protein n=1 Tax=Rotaria socialis TaxID=392032 RepID=A0A817QIU7_9BILA|nr:unnamed protein product [Rotaria socialis]